MPCEAAQAGDFSGYCVEIVQVVRRDRTCSRFYTGWVRIRNSPALQGCPVFSRVCVKTLAGCSFEKIYVSQALIDRETPIQRLKLVQIVRCSERGLSFYTGSSP
jgi:hypothetical protein